MKQVGCIIRAAKRVAPSQINLIAIDFSISSGLAQMRAALDKTTIAYI